MMHVNPQHYKHKHFMLTPGNNMQHTAASRHLCSSRLSKQADACESAACAPVPVLPCEPPMLGPPRGCGARGGVPRKHPLHPLLQRLDVHM